MDARLAALGRTCAVAAGALVLAVSPVGAPAWAAVPGAAATGGVGGGAVSGAAGPVVKVSNWDTGAQPSGLQGVSSTLLLAGALVAGGVAYAMGPGRRGEDGPQGGGRRTLG